MLPSSPAPDVHVAIIGAGIAGLTAGRALHDAGFTVTVIEKSRGAGGRMSTRRLDPLAFDHGAQYFTARAPAFLAAVQRWAEAGVAGAWEGTLVDLEQGRVRPHPQTHPRYVGRPGMNAICKHLAAPLALRTQTRVVRVEAHGPRWRLTADDGVELGTYDAVVLSVPAAQARPLLTCAPSLAELIGEVSVQPCWAWLAVFDAPLDLPYDGAFVTGGPLSWVARNTSKPGRQVADDAEVWVAHASPEWTRAHLEADAEEAERLLATAFAETTGVTARAAHATVHRWRFAETTTPVGRDYLWDPALRVGVCGDWLLGAQIEAAWRSGDALASRMRRDLRPPSPDA